MEAPPLACGTQFCNETEVCCFKKVAPFAICVPPEDYVADGCQEAEVTCLVPRDCPAGLACCYSVDPVPAVTCRPDQLCPGAGQEGTYRTCTSSDDCPGALNSCGTVSAGADGGAIRLKLCGVSDL